MKSKTGTFFKRITVLAMSAVMAFCFFGCTQEETGSNPPSQLPEQNQGQGDGGVDREQDGGTGRAATRI